MQYKATIVGHGTNIVTIRSTGKDILKVWVKFAYVDEMDLSQNVYWDVLLSSDKSRDFAVNMLVSLGFNGTTLSELNSDEVILTQKEIDIEVVEEQGSDGVVRTKVKRIFTGQKKQITEKERSELKVLEKGLNISGALMKARKEHGETEQDIPF